MTIHYTNILTPEFVLLILLTRLFPNRNKMLTLNGMSTLVHLETNVTVDTPTSGLWATV
jgi:hypothetical protein